MQPPIPLRKWSSLICIIILSVLAAGNPARADEEDDEYLSILSTIEKGDALEAKGQAAPALDKYREARAAMISFQKAYPKWNAKVIAYRLRYLGEKTEALTEKIKLSTPAAPSAAANANPGSKAASIARIKLLDAGSEPRAVLRFHPKVGDKHTLNMLLKTTIGVNLGENEAPPVKMPRMSVAMDITVTAISQDGDISYDMQVGEASIAEDADATPALVAAMKGSLDNFKGISGKGMMSNRGVSETSDLKVPSKFDPQARQVMGGVKDSLVNGIVMLPEEAVGPGAKWEVKQKQSSQGLTIDETITYELQTLEKDHLTAKATVADQAANQKIESPAMPGMKLNLEKLTGTGTGSFTVDLSQILPSEAEADNHSELALGMGAGEQKQSMAMKLDVSVRLETK